MRWASILGWRVRPSMLLAWGSDEREHARLGSAMSCSGGMERVEDAEESDFWDGMLRVTWRRVASRGWG